jgi:transcriptional regulator with XRE-family HTH domain
MIGADTSVMKTGLYSNNFSSAFRKILEVGGVSRYKIADFTGLDDGYLGKLCSGEKNNPSPETLVKICIALAHFSEKLPLSDLEELFNSVGRSILVRRFSNR